MPIFTTIATLRIKNGISQATLAEAIGVSQNAISLWETNKTVPPLKQIIALADYFGVTIDYLVGREAQPAAVLTMEVEPPAEDEAMPDTPQALELFVRRIVDQALDERQ